MLNLFIAMTPFQKIFNKFLKFLQIHIFTNLDSLDFSDIEDYPALEKKELTWGSDSGGTTNRIILAGPKFQVDIEYFFNYFAKPKNKISRFFEEKYGFFIYTNELDRGVC